jgi:hypothetical protein
MLAILLIFAFVGAVGSAAIGARDAEEEIAKHCQDFGAFVIQGKRYKCTVQETTGVQCKP